LKDLIDRRVKRGKDWGWGEQDKRGEGTITGLTNNNTCVFVKWDWEEGEAHYDYRMGDKGRWDLEIRPDTRPKEKSKLETYIEHKSPSFMRALSRETMWNAYSSIFSGVVCATQMVSAGVSCYVESDEMKVERFRMRAKRLLKEL
jgi:hypothetical protein